MVINQDLSLLDADAQRTFRELLHIFEHCLLPGLTRGTGSSALSEEIFAVMKMLPYTIRLVSLSNENTLLLPPLPSLLLPFLLPFLPPLPSFYKITFSAFTDRFTLYFKTKSDYYPMGHPLGIVARSIALANAKWFQKYPFYILPFEAFETKFNLWWGFLFVVEMNSFFSFVNHYIGASIRTIRNCAAEWWPRTCTTTPSSSATM